VETSGNVQARQEDYDTSDAVPRPRKKSKKQPVDEGTLEDVVETFWKFLQRGIEAGMDDTGMKDGFIVATLHEIQEAEEPLNLRNYQIHAINRIIYILQSGGKGALLAYAMGLGKTVIVIRMYSSNMFGFSLIFS
jgi:SNF2 family DNA or RNA helicase